MGRQEKCLFSYTLASKAAISGFFMGSALTDVICNWFVMSRHAPIVIMNLGGSVQIVLLFNLQIIIHSRLQGEFC